MTLISRFCLCHRSMLPDLLLIMLTSLAPSPIAMVTELVCFLTNVTMSAFCPGVTRQHSTDWHCFATLMNVDPHSGLWSNSAYKGIITNQLRAGYICIKQACISMAMFSLPFSENIIIKLLKLEWHLESSYLQQGPTVPLWNHIWMDSSLTHPSTKCHRNLSCCFCVILLTNQQTDTGHVTFASWGLVHPIGSSGTKPEGKLTHNRHHKPHQGAVTSTFPSRASNFKPMRKAWRKASSIVYIRYF